MSDPGLIHMLTEDYKHMMSGDYRSGKYVDEPVKERKIHKSFKGWDTMMDATQLFKILEPQLDSSDFYQMVVDGQPGSGKSTLARELTHYAHLAGYKPLYSSGFDVTEAPAKFVKAVIGHNKVCIIFDDLSYVLSATSAKAQSKIKSFFALIRHFLTQANNGIPVKVMIIVISHFTTAVPPLFKNSNVWVFSKPTTLEFDNMIKIVGRKQESRQELDTMFTALVQIQTKAASGKPIYLDYQNERYEFIWGNKENPGSGRLMLLILNGKPYLYVAKNTFCEECKHIGFGVQIKQEDYHTQRPSDEDADAAKKRGTQ